MSAVLIVLVLPFALALAAMTDIREMTIPNVIPASLLLFFFILAPFSSLDLADIAMSLMAGFTVLAVCFALFALNVMGGGDAKLLTASAVWYGFNFSLVEFLVAVSVAGGALAFALLLLRSQRDTAIVLGVALPAPIMEAKKIPYGIAIAIGGFMTIEQAPIYSAALRALY